MENDFQVELLRSDATMTDSKIFMDKFDRKERFMRLDWDGFLDATEVRMVTMQCRPHKPYQAYAPCPMVLDTIRKGSSWGNGAS